MMRLTKPGYGYTLGNGVPKTPTNLIINKDHTNEWNDCPDVGGPIATTKYYRLMQKNKHLGPEPVHIDFS